MHLHYEPHKLEDLPAVIKSLSDIKFARRKKKIKYFELPCAFDIETSSWRDEKGEKRACMYVWQFGICGHVFMGRTWQEFLTFYNQLIELLCVTPKFCLIVYVHNLSYEFQFMRKWFSWEKVFAIKSRVPVYARTVEGVEFRCSYILSGYSLAKLADQLQTYQIHKRVGDLDYRKIRNSKTPLSPEEVGYCVNDVLVVMAYIDERIKADGSIGKIPLTKTGYVRKYCKNQCFYTEGKPRKKDYKRVRYHDMISRLTIEPDEYIELKEVFSGGYTHASAFYSGVTVNDVTSYDFTSSYPYVMVSEQFPMTKGVKVKITSSEQFYDYIKYYACMFRADFYGIRDTFIYDHYISHSKCRNVENAVRDNGRIVSADHLQITLTEKDFLIIRKTYEWDKLVISSMYVYERGYLPTDFVKSILKLYADKSTLKNVPGKEVEYLASKEMVNACYGMICTDILQENNPYENDMWLPSSLPDLESALNIYNNSYGRFLYYPWGCWVTSASRYNLWTGIYELGEDYVYSDTDSIKAVNMDKHMDYINKYNERVKRKLERACKVHGIPIEMTEPKTIKGEKKPLGVWDYDGHFDRFRTLGAKRYMVDIDGDINITVSGLNKHTTVPYLCDGWRINLKDKTPVNDPFETFKTSLYVPGDYTGKMTHTYIDETCKGTITDYMGNKARYYEKSIIHLENADYSLSVAEEYLSYLQGLEEMD